MLPTTAQLESVRLPSAQVDCGEECPRSESVGTRRSEVRVLALATVLGLLSFGVILAAHNITDADLWAKLALGAHVWKFGTVTHSDMFAFTPTLPEYVDHEWGAGTILFGLLKFFGPASLMWLKIGLAVGTVIVAVLIGSPKSKVQSPKSGASWGVLLVLAIPASACILLGYVPVIRSHAFTYFFFAVTLFCLERLVHSPQSARPAFVIVAVMWVWANVHGGFVAGLGTIAVYTCVVLLPASWGALFRLRSCVRTLSPESRPSPMPSPGTGTAFRGLLAKVVPYAIDGAGVPLSSGRGVRSEGEFRQRDKDPAPPGGAPICNRLLPFSGNQSQLEAGAPGKERKQSRLARIILLVALASLAVTCINPYGVKFWGHLLPAVLAKRAQISEWQPLPVFAVDVFMPFRILFLLVVLAIIAGWQKPGTEGNEGNEGPSFSSLPSLQNCWRRSWTGLIMLGITACLGWRSRRHAPFFGIASLAFAGPYLGTSILQVIRGLKSRVSPRSTVHGPQPAAHQSINPSIHQSTWRVRPATIVLALYGLVAVYAVVFRLPLASFQVLSPVGHDPVREADILSLAHAEGNLATPFHWGSYLAWRLYPAIRISMDGRYEAAYPESTFQLNNALFDVTGPDWDRLLRQYPVDFIILDLAQERLRPQDLKDRGYELIWVTERSSALLALEKHAAKLRDVVNHLPPTTINPLDATITDKWWNKQNSPK